MLRGAVYFLLVFAAGFVLGIVRVLLLVPQFGERLAELYEAPLMLIVIILSARFVTRRYPATRRTRYLFSGAVALCILLIAEFSVVLGLRGLTIDAYFATRDPVAGAVYVLLLSIFAVMPWLLGKHAEDEKKSLQ